jgi:LmeA-like phospholipid-binding
MFSKSWDNLGEKTINKIAEMAFKSQIKNADHLRVQVKTNPQQLAKGVLESLDIDGTGLVMQRDLRLEKMKITLNNISVSPFKALMGNVQLTKPSKGSASIVLNEKDIESALNINNLNQYLQKYEILHHNQPVTVKFFRVDCRILGDGRIMIKAKLRILETNSQESVCLIIKPRICTIGNNLLMDDVECTQGTQFSPILIKAILDESLKVLNLDRLSVDGISLKINHVSTEDGKLRFLAIAGITHLPKMS